MDLQSIADARDHFALLGVDRRFDLNQAQLQSRYLELARLTHPDFAGADVDAQMQAMELSARVNEAHRILANPEERANYLLGLLGGPGKQDDSSLPEGFLAEMMALREELAEAQAEADRLALSRIQEQARRQKQERLAEIGRLFAAVASQSAETAVETRRRIRNQLNALRYVQRLLEQA